MAVQSELASPIIADEDRLRAETYILLAMLLAAPPTEDLLEIVAGLHGDDSEFGTGINALAAAAASADRTSLASEYHELFIGLQLGELVPYASYYATGSLFSKPLARLRMDMARLGIARARRVNEPEDHIAGLCEMMAGLILGSFSEHPLPLTEQKEFFQKHLLPWAPRFFEDLERAPSAGFYRPVGTVGKAYVEIEKLAFVMID